MAVESMTKEILTGLLAQRVLGWTVAPDRFLMGDRRWLPRWRFQPAEKLEDAFQLLDESAPQEYSICGSQSGNIYVRVVIRGISGEARESCTPLAITYAVARALGIEVGE